MATTRIIPLHAGKGRTVCPLFFSITQKLENATPIINLWRCKKHRKPLYFAM